MCKEKVYKSVPYVKGQVFMVDEPKIVTEARMAAGTHCQVKTRPYLIYLSDSDAQLNFNVVQGFPISTNGRLDENKRSFYDFDIRFKNQFGEVNRVITGQLTTIDCRYIKKYLFTLPEECMMEIDNLMMRRFGIGGSICQMSKQIEELENRLFQLKSESSQLFNSFNYEIEKNGNITPVEVKEDPASITTITKAPDRGPSINYTDKGRIRWTRDLAVEFLDDCKKLGDVKTSERWHIPLNIIPQKKFYCKKKIGGGVQLQYNATGLTLQ